MKETRIVILSTTDVHGKIAPYNYANKEFDPKGMAKAASLIHETRHKEENVILLDNGDLIQGTPLAHYALTVSEAPNPAICIHNLLRYDAAVIGNHEFNYGKEKLEKVINESQFPWLSANVVKRGTTEPFFGKPYITKNINGIKISILGLTTKFIPIWESKRNIEAFDFLDPVDVGKCWVQYLKEEKKSDLIIVSYHGGLEKDPETFEQISPNNGENQGISLLNEIDDIDVLITGHQHLLYANSIKDKKIVLQAGTQAAYVGRIDLIVEKNDEGCKVKHSSVELLPTKDCKVDIEVLKEIQVIDKQVENWLDAQIGVVSKPITINDPLHDVWLHEHPLIEWINKTLMKVANTKIACTPLLNTEKFTLRESITRRDMYAVYPFSNTLVILELTGEDVLNALEISASFLTKDYNGSIQINPDWKKPRLLSYNFDMWEGIDYCLDLKKSIGQRVISASFQGKPLSFEKHLVATSSYRASGSGGYTMFGTHKIVKEIHKDIAEILVSELQNEKILKTQVNNNWKVLYE